MLGLKQVHHIAIIATDYAVSKAFYCDILVSTLQSAVIAKRATRGKGIWRLMAILIELFSFPFPPERPSRPEACGLVIWLLALMISMRQWRTLKAIT